MSKIKILVGYHKPAVLIKDEIFTPIHLGRAVANEASKDEKSADEASQIWLKENLIGDDSGENISNLNRYFNEMSGIYWAWKNYEKLGNPEFIGFSHYRRHLIADENINMPPRRYANYHPIFERVEEKYLDAISFKNVDLENFDIFAPRQIWVNSVAEFHTLNYGDIEGLLELEKILAQNPKFSAYTQLTKNYRQKHLFYPCNVFVMRRELFFEYCEFAFGALFELFEKMRPKLEKMDYWQKRSVGFIAECLTDLFIQKQRQKGKNVKELELSFVENTNSGALENELNLLNFRANLKNVKCVSFDLFDTILMRPYAKPIDVFKHIEKVSKAKGFFKERVKAEFNACKKFNQKQAKFSEIYEVMPSKFQNLKEMERELEAKTLYLNPFMKQLFNEAREAGKKIIFASDMYYEGEFLGEILEKLGLKADALYVSADTRKTKYHGDLYEFILQESGFLPNEILHIGDNYFSDFEMAKKAGLNALFIRKPLESFFEEYPKLKIFFEVNQSDLDASVILGVGLKKWLENDKSLSYWDAFGYIYGGATCYGLTKFIFDKARELGLDNLILLARDGFTVEKIFNVLQDHFENLKIPNSAPNSSENSAQKHIKTHYVYGSRNIFDNLDFMNSLNDKNPSPLRQPENAILEAFKDEIEEFKSISAFDVTKTKEQKIALINRYKDKIAPIAKSRGEAYLKYLESFNFDKNAKFGFFDICTGSFRSFKFFKDYLKNDEMIAFYYLVDLYNLDLLKGLNICTYRCTYRCKQTHWLLENLITAPEFSIKNISSDLSFERLENAYERKVNEIYEKIWPLEFEFSRDLLAIFGKFEVNISAQINDNLLEFFQNLANFEDVEKFSKLFKGYDIGHTKYSKILGYHPMHCGAPDRIKNHLSYKLGQEMISANSARKILALLFKMGLISLNHWREKNLKKRLGQRLPPLYDYIDYAQSFKVKKHLSYRLGLAFLKNPLKFPFKIRQIYEEFKSKKLG